MSVAITDRVRLEGGRGQEGPAEAAVVTALLAEQNSLNRIGSPHCAHRLLFRGRLGEPDPDDEKCAAVQLIRNLPAMRGKAK